VEKIKLLNPHFFEAATKMKQIDLRFPKAGEIIKLFGPLPG
jgi:hypothetical protein